MEQDHGFQNYISMINYNYIFKKINEAKTLNYNINELQNLAWQINFSENEVLIEDEDLFLKTFSELLYYFDIEIVDDENFKDVIDDLIKYSNQYLLDRYDILFILNKKNIINFLEKYTNGKISLNVLKKQLEKLLKLSEYCDIIKLLLKYKLDIPAGVSRTNMHPPLR